MAVKGHLNTNGSGFIVSDFCYADLNQADVEPTLSKSLSSQDHYICLVSGLGFAQNMKSNEKLSKSLNILYDIITGNSPFMLEKPVVSLIVAGNSIGIHARDEEKEANSKAAGVKDEPWNKSVVVSHTVQAVKLMDTFYANVGQFMNVDIMPGLLDPTTVLFPQQALHPCMFPNAYKLDSIKSVTNPHKANYYGINLLGTSGQNVESIRSCTTFTDSIDIMRKMMEWSHIAPTCPDLLYGYPFPNSDPLAVTEYPDVFFCGNQPEFSVGSFLSNGGKKVHLISVPIFEEKFMAVMVNLRTLQTELLCFD